MRSVRGPTVISYTTLLPYSLWLLLQREGVVDFASHLNDKAQNSLDPPGPPNFSTSDLELN